MAPRGAPQKSLLGPKDGVSRISHFGALWGVSGFAILVHLTGMEVGFQHSMANKM